MNRESMEAERAALLKEKLSLDVTIRELRADVDSMRPRKGHACNFKLLEEQQRKLNKFCNRSQDIQFRLGEIRTASRKLPVDERPAFDNFNKVLTTSALYAVADAVWEYLYGDEADDELADRLLAGALEQLEARNPGWRKSRRAFKQESSGE